jgi:transcriptional regulator GlxA family with amidase domain
MRKVGFIIAAGYQPMGFAVTTPFEFANEQVERPFYDIRLLSQQGGPVRTSLGFSILTEQFVPEKYDSIIFGSSRGDPLPETVALARIARLHCRRLATTCHGTFTFAAAGLLDGRRATTHWARANELRSRFPKILVEEDRIFIGDGDIWTSAGMTAGIDLALALVEADLGTDVVRMVARRLVLYHRRAGGQSQFSALLELQPKSDRMQKVLTFARAHLADQLGVDDLAGVAHLSPRQFSRAFQAETGQTPAKAVENLRLDGARTLLENTSHTLDTVAQLTGFGDRSRMRRAFLRAYGQPPNAIRRQTHGYEPGD